MESYKKKYLQYKNKYKLLKSQIGGEPNPTRIRKDLEILMKMVDFVSFIKESPESSEPPRIPKINEIKFQNKKFTWKVFLIGPANTPYEGYKWIVKIDFPEDYPFIAPNINFETKIFHPNISYETGTLFLFNDDTTNEHNSWNPGIKLVDLFKKIKVLLTEQPNLSQPLNSVALTLFKKSVGYSEKVRSYVEEHAISSL